MLGGLKTSAMAGANLNSDRIKGMESTASVSYNFSDQVSGQRTARQSAVVGESPLFTDGLTEGNSRSHRVGVNFELEKKDTKKYNFVFSPSFRFSSGASSSHNRSTTTDVRGGDVNGTDAATTSDSRAFRANGRISGGVKDIGKERRSVTLTFNYNFQQSMGGSREDSRTWYGSTLTPRNLRYDNDGGTRMLSGTLSYLEPFGQHWGLSAQFSPLWQQHGSTKAAFNTDGSANDYYSSTSRSDYLLLRKRLQMQWRKESNQFYFGVQHDRIRNEVRARSQGRDTESGIGEWMRNWSPFITFRYSAKSGHSFSARYEGSSNQVSGTQILPVMDISNPLQVSTGNVYLRPTFRHYAYLDWSHNNPKTFSYVSTDLSWSMTQRGIQAASWFDADGIRYAVPVNTRKPTTSLSGYLIWRMPVGQKKHLTLQGVVQAGVTSSTSYQATSRRAGMDLLTFDYNAFMADFWGDASGSRFYSGQSGFAESRTSRTDLTAQLGATYRLERFSASFTSVAGNQRSRYSLDASANTDYWRFVQNLELLYETLQGWEFKTNASYFHFRGMAAGFDKPYCQWDLSVSKNIKAFTLSLGVSDLLNQQRSQNRTVNAEYIEDSFSLVMGRYAMFSVKWNFGRMNPAKNARIQDAMFNML